MLNKLFLISNDDKKMASWIAEKRKKLKGMQLEHFNLSVQETRYAPFHVRATFICYWEMMGTGALSKMMLPIANATLVHMLHNFVEREAHEEVHATGLMITNFLRLMNNMGGKDEEE